MKERVQVQIAYVVYCRDFAFELLRYTSRVEGPCVSSLD
jgi:hypothetical protein